MEIDYELIGKRIKEARKKKGWSQERLAEAIDVAVAYVSRIERGYQINLKKLSQISIALDVTMEYLVSGVSVNSENYLDKELEEILKKCTPEQQKMIYNVSKAILNSKLKTDKDSRPKLRF